MDISDIQKDLYQEHYSKRENLMFLGIQENDAAIDAESETENNNV